MENSVSTIVLWHEKSICRLDEELCTLSHRSVCITPVVCGSESDAAMGVAPGETLPAMKNAGMGEGRGRYAERELRSFRNSRRSIPSP